MTGLQLRVIALRDRVAGFSLQALAAHTTLAGATLRNWMAGTNRESDTIRRELLPVLDRLERGEMVMSGPPPGAISVEDLDADRRPARVRRIGRDYDIEITRRIGKVLDYCYTEAALGVVTADYGSGKTHAVHAWRKAHPKAEAVVIEFSEFFAGNKCWFVHKLAGPLGVHLRGGTTGSGRVFDAVVDRLNDQPALLIFDQCEAIRLPVAQVIRQVWDATRDEGTGVVLLGAHKLYEMLRASRAQDLGALTSRVCPWAILHGCTRGEMEQILRLEGVTDIDDAATELLWRMVNGSMRLLMHAVAMIQTKHKGKAIRENVVIEIAGFLCGPQMRGGKR